VPDFKTIGRIEVDSQKLCQGLSQLIDIPSESQSRPEISGIYFNFLKNNLKIAATDSFRLAEKNITIDGSSKEECSFIIPQKPARDLIGILENKEGPLVISFSSNQVLFDFSMKETKHPQVQLISRLIEGEYPNYQEIIPSKFKTTAVLRRDEFLSQIKIASLFSGRINEVKVSLNPTQKEVSFFSKSPDVGESNSKIEAKIKGEPIEVSFNYKYLADGLQNIKSSEVLFEVSKKEGPCVLRPVGDSSYLYVVMPIKSL
jgi:DNA polymerase-3 subunit beta